MLKRLIEDIRWGYAISVGVVGALLVWALDRHPYSYYQLLRWMVCGVSAFGVYFASERENKFWMAVLGIVAILFNPIISIHLDRETWAIIDLIVAIIFVVSVPFLKKY